VQRHTKGQAVRGTEEAALQKILATPAVHGMRDVAPQMTLAVLVYVDRLDYLAYPDGVLAQLSGSV
jgi:hypothetical protein